MAVPTRTASSQKPGLPKENPLLASFFRIYGYFLLLAGLIAALVSYKAGSGGDDPVTPVLTAIGALLSFGTLALIAFGIAQIINYIARIAVAAEQTALRALGQSGGAPAGTALPVAAPVAAPSPRKTAQDLAQAVAKEMEEADPTASCPHCNRQLRIATLRRGANVCPGCHQEFEVE